MSHGEDQLILDLDCVCFHACGFETFPLLHEQKWHISPDELCFPAATSYPPRSFFVAGTDGDCEDPNPRTTGD